MSKLSVVLATYNEESNLAWCLEGVIDIADEIIIIDGSSTDRTVEIAKSYGAKVKIEPNQTNFHINKQMAINSATCPWILQLDADERVSSELAKEIMEVIDMNDQEIEDYQDLIKKKELFIKHQLLLEARDGKLGDEKGEYAGFFIPRLNFFLGGYLKHGGVYPDGVIRLVKRGKAFLPAKDVHEQIKVNGKVGWLEHNLIHRDSPTFKRYLERNNRYINIMVEEFKSRKLDKNATHFIEYVFLKSTEWFLLTFFRHKGILDGWRGFVFSFYSALRFPKAYIRYLFS